MASASTWFSCIDESVGNPVSDVDKRERQSLWSDKRGSALIEGAIVVPVLIAFLSGVFEFSCIFINGTWSPLMRMMPRVPGPVISRAKPREDAWDGAADTQPSA